MPASSFRYPYKVTIISFVLKYVAVFHDKLRALKFSYMGVDSSGKDGIETQIHNFIVKGISTGPIVAMRFFFDEDCLIGCRSSAPSNTRLRRTAII